MSRYKQLNKYFEKAGIPEEYWDFIYHEEDEYVLYDCFIRIRNEMLVEALGVESIEFGDAIWDFKYSLLEKIVPDAFNEYQSQSEKRKYVVEFLSEYEQDNPFLIKELDEIWHASTSFHV